MKEQRKRWGPLAFVAAGLVIVALLSLSSSAWATPAQKNPLQQTVPCTKKVDKETVCAARDEKLTYTIQFGFDAAWTDVQIVDEINPPLQIDDVTLDVNGLPPLPGFWAWDYDDDSGRLTVSIPSVPAGAFITITIYATVPDTIPGNIPITNVACEYIQDKRVMCCGERVYVKVRPCVEEFVPEAGSLLLLGSGLAGLAGYAGMRWRARRR